MKSLVRISQALYEDKWLILPSVHRKLQEAFEAYLKGNESTKAQMSEDDMMPEDEPMSGSMMQEVATTLIISIDGVIGKRLSAFEKMCTGACDLNDLNAALKEADADPAIKTIILDINSPGGTVTGVAETGELIADIASRKRCIAYTETQMCSAAYWLASQTNAIYSTPSATVGSIGVYMALMDTSRKLENEGIKVNVISAGKYKVSGAPWQPLTDEERAMFQEDVDALYAQFKSAVLNTRTIADSDLQGQVFDGTKALNKGFIDGNVNDMDQLLELIAET